MIDFEEYIHTTPDGVIMEVEVEVFVDNKRKKM